VMPKSLLDCLPARAIARVPSAPVPQRCPGAAYHRAHSHAQGVSAASGMDALAPHQLGADDRRAARSPRRSDSGRPAAFRAGLSVVPRHSALGRSATGRPGWKQPARAPGAVGTRLYRHVDSIVRHVSTIRPGASSIRPSSGNSRPGGCRNIRTSSSAAPPASARASSCCALAMQACRKGFRTYIAGRRGSFTTSPSRASTC
jgi:hypothetical protein